MRSTISFLICLLMAVRAKAQDTKQGALQKTVSGIQLNHDSVVAGVIEVARQADMAGCPILRPPLPKGGPRSSILDLLGQEL